MDEYRSRLVCEWLRLAREDLRYAKTGITQDLEPKYSAFHSQQAVEKALKALILALGSRIPKTHDIDELLERLSRLGVDTRELYEMDADMLTDYAVEARYPGPPVSEEEAREAYTIAENVLQWIREELRKLGIECMDEVHNP